MKALTLDQAVSRARDVAHWHKAGPNDALRSMHPDDAADVGELAQYLLDTFSESLPCGFSPARVITDDRHGNKVAISLGNGEYVIDPSILRTLCGQWLRACDEAEPPA